MSNLFFQNALQPSAVESNGLSNNFKSNSPAGEMQPRATFKPADALIDENSSDMPRTNSGTFLFSMAASEFLYYLLIFIGGSIR